MISLYLKEISTKVINAFSNEFNLFGTFHNKYNKLAASVQVLLMSALAGNKIYLKNLIYGKNHQIHNTLRI